MPRLYCRHAIALNVWVSLGKENTPKPAYITPSLVPKPESVGLSDDPFVFERDLAAPLQPTASKPHSLSKKRPETAGLMQPIIKLPRLENQRSVENESPDIVIEGFFVSDGRPGRDSPVTPQPDAGPIVPVGSGSSLDRAGTQVFKALPGNDAVREGQKLCRGNSGSSGTEETAKANIGTCAGGGDGTAAINELLAVVKVEGQEGRSSSAKDSGVTDLDSPPRPMSTADVMMEAKSVLTDGEAFCSLGYMEGVGLSCCSLPRCTVAGCV